MARNAMVLGATGMVGEALCRELVEQGWEVSGAARLSDPNGADGLRQIGVEVSRFDVTADDPSRLPDADVVLLEVWDPTKPELIWPINFYGVGRVVERYAGSADIVNGCTVNVYGDGPEAPNEEASPRPNSDYGRSRYAQERLIDYFCVQRGSKGIHVRYAHSNTAKRGVVRRMAETILAGKSLGTGPDALTQVIALEDFVRVTIAATDRVSTPPAVVNCCHPRVWTRRELAEAIRDRLGSGEVIFDEATGGREHSTYADPSRMVEWFGPPTVPAAELIDRVARDLGAE